MTEKLVHRVVSVWLFQIVLRFICYIYIYVIIVIVNNNDDDNNHNTNI